MELKTVYDDRMQVLINFLKQEVNPDLFDMWSWTSRNGSHETLHCAAGWAGTIPVFQKQGFRLANSGVPCFEGKIGFEAVWAFFGLDYRSANRLFLGSSYWPDCDPRIETVVGRMEEYLRPKSYGVIEYPPRKDPKK